jgi:dihydropteroate synthase
MGILNLTPDSFYAHSRFSGTDAVLQQAERMLEAGAAWIDIGAQSTRPGSIQAGAQAETARLGDTITTLLKHFPDLLISIDTYYAAVARFAVEQGASMVNDISGGRFDPEMLSTAAALQVPYVCMHLEGNADTMHQTSAHEHITRSVIDYFLERIQACQAAGIHDIILDSGFGFSKTRAENFQLLRELDSLHILQHPLLIGVSRKSMIHKTLGITPEEALNGTTVLHTASLLAGAHFLRVHDVKEAVEAVCLVDQLLAAGS